MSINNLENLVDAGQLKKEPGDQREFQGLVRSGRARLEDTKVESLSLESRFDLANNAAHALSLAVLRWHGYRAGNRYVVFQCLPHTLGAGPEVWRLLAHCHGLRNRGEYDGLFDIDERLITELITTTENILELLQKLEPIS